MEIKDTIAYPAVIEVDKADGESVEYFNYPGIHNLKWEKDVSEKLTISIIDFAEGCDIRCIKIYHSNMPLLDNLGEQITESESKSACVVWSAMVSMFDEVAANTMVDTDFEFSVTPSSCFLKREVNNGRICYSPVFIRRTS